MKHNLLNIEVLIKKTLVFAGLFVASYSVIAGFASISSVFLEKYIQNQWISLVPSVLVIVLMLRPLELFLINITDKFLFQKKYDYRELLKRINNETLALRELDELLETTVHNIANIIKLDNAHIVLSGEYWGDKKVSLKVLGPDGNDALHDICGIIGVDTTSPVDLCDAEKINTVLHARMVVSGVCLIVPLSFRGELLGVLALGKKLSDEEYVQDDKDILVSLSYNLSIAIMNANATKEIAQTEKTEALGGIISELGHQINNRLARASGQIQHMLHTSDLLDRLGEDAGGYDMCVDELRDMIFQADKYVDEATDIVRKARDYGKG